MSMLDEMSVSLFLKLDEMSFYGLCLINASFMQVSDGRRNTDVRNRKKDADEDDNQQFTVS